MMHKKLLVTYDKAAQALYIFLSLVNRKDIVAKTDIVRDCTVILDKDAKGKVLGIEIIGLKI